MKVINYINALTPQGKADELRNLYNEKCEYERLQTVYGDYDKSLEKHKAMADFCWERARKQKEITNENVIHFVSAYNMYNKVLRGDRELMLITAEAQEKLVNYKYDGLIDKKYWEGDHLLYILEYLEDGKAKTIEEAVECYEKDGGTY